MSVIDNVTNNDSANSNQSASDLLAQLVGEGKKYPTVEALAASKLSGDDHIKQIERENAMLRDTVKQLEEQTKTNKTLTEVIDALKQNKGTGEPNPANAPSLEELTKLVRSTVSQTKEEERRAANRNLVDEGLVAKFGTVDAAAKQVRDKARELGLGPAQIKDLSETSPAAFLQLFGATNPPPPTNPVVQGNVNSEALKTLVPSDGRRNYKYYSALKKQMGPAKFHGDLELMRQYGRDMDEQGDSFLT